MPPDHQREPQLVCDPRRTYRPHDGQQVFNRSGPQRSLSFLTYRIDPGRNRIYAQAMDAVSFFDDYVVCHSCNADTMGIVYEHSCKINCDNCDAVLFDASGLGNGTVVILELDDEVIQ